MPSTSEQIRMGCVLYFGNEKTTMLLVKIKIGWWMVYRSDYDAGAHGGVSFADAYYGFTNADPWWGVRLAIITQRYFPVKWSIGFFIKEYVPTLSDEFTISACRELNHSNSKHGVWKAKTYIVLWKVK